jgi:EF hand
MGNSDFPGGLFHPDCLAVFPPPYPPPSLGEGRVGVPARKRFIWIVYSTFCLALGCSIGGARVHAPSLSPGSAAAKAMEEYDTNNDGRLDAQELDRCPALKNSLARFDKDNDGFLTAKEIADRLASYQKNGVGLIALTCKVFLDRRPLAGAHVTFVPESFLGSAFKPAKGVTNDTGKAVMKVEGANTPGVPCGLYRIEVSKQNPSGRETLPAKYNAQTTLGEEVAPDLRSSGITLRLRSR